MLPEKEGARSPRIRTVTDPAAASVLVDPARLQQLEPFIGQPRTVSEAARRGGAKPNTVLKRVQRFVDLGLLEVAAIEPRAGRAIRRYRASADVFFVPFEATSAETLEAALAERDAHFEAQLRRNVARVRREAIGVWGTRVYRDPEGRLQIQTALGPEANVTTLDPDGPAALSAWRDQVWLDFDDAKALQRQLFELLLRYQRKKGAQRYLVRVAMAPLLDP